MTHRLALFYHCLLQGTVRPINTALSIELITEQLGTMEACGLVDNVQEMFIGVNGDEDDADVVRLLAPKKATVIAHGKGTGTEITTMNLIREWVKARDGWYVCYGHEKGISHPPNMNTTWRLNMESHVWHNWRMCVLDLDKGYDAVGSYWLTPEEHKNVIKTPFFGGTYWWSKASYLATLPPLPPPEFENRYEAEGWIGSAPRRPRVRNYIEGWPPGTF